MQSRLQLALATVVSLAAFTQSADAQDFIEGCNQSQTDQVASYQAYAGLQLLTASDYIGRVLDGADTTRFDYWFGNHDPAIVDRVSTIMEGIYYSLEYANYHCDPCDRPDTGPGTVAYVFPDDAEMNVYLCDDFFDQTTPETLNTWVLGVVSHEMSHFFGTLDEPYEGAPTPNSPAAAHQIALDSASTAANISYNYQYFISDTERPL